MSDTQTQPSLFSGHAALAESARSLRLALQAAPAQEPRRATALRNWLTSVTEVLALRCDGNYDAEQARHYSQLISKLRALTAELNVGAPPVPPGIVVVLQAFLDRLFTEGFLLFRPGQDVYYGEEFLSPLQAELAEIDLIVPAVPNMPKQVFVFYYPPGEQDNVLACSILLRNLYQALLPEAPFAITTGLATRALGPAYVFSLFAMTEWVAGGDPRFYRLPVKCSAVLREEGWFEHPALGPILETLCTRYEIHPAAVDPTQDATWGDFTPLVQAYLPSDFDRDVPILWERLSQLLPPNDMDINAVESDQPADLISILNAGWSFYLMHREEMHKMLGSRTPQDLFDAKTVLNRLLTKGVELSQIAHSWSEARKATA